MKKILSLLLCLWCTLALGQTQIWSAQYDVSGLGYSNIRPRVALTTNNAPIVLWGDDANNIVYTATWNGSGFDAPVRVHSLTSDAFTSYWAGPEIDASGDTVFIGLKIMPEDQHGVYSVRSVDGGQTYDDTVRIDLSGDSLTRFPTVAIAAGGKPVFAYMKFDMNWMDPQYHVANSSDGGLTFNDDVNATALASGEVCDCCPANLQIQGDRQLLTFRNNENNLRESWAAISDDGGASFPSAKRIDSTGWVIFSCPSVGPDAVLNGDEVTAVYMSAGNGPSKVYVSESNVTSFDIDFQSRLDNWDTITAFSNYPRIAGDGNVIAAVWQNMEFGNVNVYFSSSTTGAADLVDNIDTVNISTVGNQQSPDVAYADGTFHIVWQDNDSGVVMYRSVTVPYTGISEVDDQSMHVVVSPNPFSTSTIITFDNPYGERYLLTVYDIAGKLISETRISGSSAEVSASGLKPGTYFYVLEGAGKKQRGKLMVH